MPEQDGLRFLFDIQDKITAKLAKIEAKAKASAAKIDSAFTKASKAQEANASKVVHTENLRGIAVASASAKATAARTKETTQGKILAQRLASAQANEARKAENFRIAAAKRTAVGIAKSERAIANAKLKTNRTFKAFSTATFAGMVSAAGAIALARKAWTTFTGIIKSSFSLWGEQEQSVVAMTTALKAQGTYTPALAKQYQDLASELQGLSTDGDETLLKMQALLVQVGDVGPEKMKGALTAAQDLAVGLDTDLKTAALLVGKAFAGDTSTLRRYGIMLDQTELKQRGVAVVLEAIQDKFGGQAAAKAKTFAGTIEQLGNSWGDLKEKIGEWLTQSSGLLTPMLGKINDAVAWLNTNFDSLKPILAGLATLIGVTLVGALAAAGVAIWAMVPAIAAMTGGLSLIIPIIAIVAAALVGAWVKWGDVIKDFLREIWAKMLNKIGAGLKTLSKFVGVFHKGWAKAMKEAGEGLEETSAGIKANAAAAAAAAKAAKKEAAAQVSRDNAEAKAAVAREKAAKKAEAAEKKSKVAADKSAAAVNALTDSWTGATIKSGEFLRAYKKLSPEQKKNDRIMDQVLDKYSGMRKVLGPFNAELEAQWKATERLNPELAAQRKETEKLEKAAKELAEKALRKLNKEQEQLKKVSEELNERLATQRRRLLNLPTEDAIRDFGELTRTWEGLNDEVKQDGVLKRYGEELKNAAKAGHKLDAAQLEIVESMQESAKATSRFDLALAGIAGKMGGATGQALNLVIAMREHNKTQDAAAAAGEKTESKFSEMETGAAKVAFAFTAIGEAIGGTAGKVLTELGNIASAFATGGYIGAIIAGTAALIKVFSNWGGADAAEMAGRETAHSFRQGVIAGLSEEQMAEVQDSWDQGWDSSVIIAVRDALVESGMEYDAARVAAGRWYDALWEAEKEGPEAVERVTGQIQTILDAGEKAYAAAAASAQKRRDSEMAALTKHQTEVLNLIEAEQTAALDALAAEQEARLSELKAAQQRELDALASARNAQLSVVEASIQRKLEDERIKAQLKIDIRKAGGDQEAIDAANARAAAATENLLERDELNELMAEAEDRIRARYQDELDTIAAHWDEKDTLVKERQAADLTEMETYHATARQAEEQFWAEGLAEWTAHFDQKIADMKEAHANEIGETITFVETINETTLQLRDRTITITTVHAEEHSIPLAERDLDARQHGGPVSAGRPYRVGEGGPEMFVPSQSGRIEPHGSSGGGVDSKAIGRAVAEALEGTEIKVDGRKLGRLTVRHQPLAIAELGGRR